MENNKKSRQEYQRNYYYKNREQRLLKILKIMALKVVSYLKMIFIYNIKAVIH